MSAESGADGLELLQNGDVDTVVSDLRMKGMDGVTFLKRVKESHPLASRILLSGFTQDLRKVADEEDLEYVLPKPWDSDHLKTALSHALERSARRRAAATWLKERYPGQSLPDLPDELTELKRMYDRGTLTVDGLDSMINRHPDIAEDLLRTVRNPAFSEGQAIDSVRRATVLLGTQTISSVVLANAYLDASLREVSSANRLRADDLRRHSVSTGCVARGLARIAGWDAGLLCAGYLAGALHDVGKGMLASLDPGSSDTAIDTSKKDSQPLWFSERNLTGTTHDEVGGNLADWWDLPSNVCSTIRYHHQIRNAKKGCRLVAAVHAADLLVQRFRIGASYNGCHERIDPDAFRLFDLDPDKLKHLREIAEIV